MAEITITIKDTEKSVKFSVTGDVGNSLDQFDERGTPAQRAATFLISIMEASKLLDGKQARGKSGS